MATRKYLEENYGLHKKQSKHAWQKVEQMNDYIWLTDINGVEREIPVFHSKYAVTGDLSPIYISDNMSGKMKDVATFTSSCLNNETCQARIANPDLICHDCYAVATQEQYDALSEHAQWQTILLSEFDIPQDIVPILDAEKCCGIARFESFGDSTGVGHNCNYIRVVKANPDVTFAIWTKNHAWLGKALELEGGKPENLICIASSYRHNIPDRWALKLFKFFDYLFTVYDTPELAAAQGVCINCGFNKCMRCKHCYTKGNGAEVNELLKDAQKNYDENYGLKGVK